MSRIFGNQVKSYIIGDAVEAIGSSVFSGCTGMTSVTLSNSITSIGNNAFRDCSNLTSITLPNGITNINSYVFSGCNQLASATMPDNITLIGKSAFPSNTKLYVKKGSKTLLTIWGSKNYYDSRTYKPYDKSTDQEILSPTLSVVSTTQTTASAKIENWCDGYTYECNGDVVKKAELNYTKLKPASTQNLKLVVSKDDVHYDVNGSFTTKGLSPPIDTWTSTASSISATGSYTEEDAKVVDSNIQIAGFEVVNGNHCSASGLNPGRSIQ